LFDENITVNGTVTVFDAGNYTIKMQGYLTLEERRDFLQTWQVRTNIASLYNEDDDDDYDECKLTAEKNK